MFKSPVSRDKANEWISISDIMSVLMLIFLFISIIYMVDVKESEQLANKERERISQIAIAYSTVQNDLYEALQDEFAGDLERWNATLERPPELSIRFNEPEVLFQRGSAIVNPRFKEILDDFFPRYLRILNSEQFREDIAEIRIEGHTSSEWWLDTPSEEAYFLNMELSQARTREVLQYCLRLLDPHDQTWVRSYITANGLSSSRLIIDSDTGEEDKDRSRRVEFKTRTNAERRIMEILQEAT